MQSEKLFDSKISLKFCENKNGIVKGQCPLTGVWGRAPQMQGLCRVVGAVGTDSVLRKRGVQGEKNLRGRGTAD
jgi:hypothetical protein